MLAATHDTELDAGPRQRGTAQERMCAATRTVKPVDDMIRFVTGPDGVVPDLKRKLPGRGLWITADRATLSDAVKRKVFERGFKRDARVEPGLVDLTEQLLVRGALDALAIAGKAGLAVTGFSKVENALAHGAVSAVLHASEARPDGVGKLQGALRQRPNAERIAIVTKFTSAQLDLALGRPNVVHAALLPGSASDTFLARFSRLERFRAGDGGCGGARN
jgi:predicted RNA-binding protein YlxR (DUF448 family)